MSSAFDLPQIEPEGFERADAARNRERILGAARRLFDERGAGSVSMDEIAEAAGVGKGTLFRRFGSRASLAAAVLSERERDFQEAIIRGEPPLGPGAPPLERLIAFGEALLDTLETRLAGLQTTCYDVGEALSLQYFHVTPWVAWSDAGQSAQLIARNGGT